MRRLSFGTLTELPAAIARPAYDAKSVGIGIVHLGIGAFHRAQTAVYTDDALAQETGDWGFCGVSLRSPDVRDRLTPQDGLYTSIEKSPRGVRRRIIGSVREVLFLGDQHERIRQRLEAPATRIVSLTVTEKGYCHDPASGRLNFQHRDIVHDLAEPAQPVSAVGHIAAALASRRAARTNGFTVLCCDNLPHNGALVEGLVREFASARDPALSRWIEDNASFPSTMVDRIVPATTDDDIVDNDRALGMHDAAAVVHEPFKQWVIEDRFVAGRPEWDRAGVQFVAEVAPFEAMKLRLLNASHSAFAYLGYLAGHEYIYQVAAQLEFVEFMRRFMREEVTPTLSLPVGVDLVAYQNTLVERFANPALPHRTWQVGVDGSQKLPPRILATVRDNLAAGRRIDLLALVVAGWMRYVTGRDEVGREIKVSDPLASEFARIAEAHRGDPRALAKALLSLRAIFGTDLPLDARFTNRVTTWLSALYAEGAAQTVAAAVRSSIG